MASGEWWASLFGGLLRLGLTGCGVEFFERDVRHGVAEFAETLEFFDGAAVEPFGLRLVTQEILHIGSLVEAVIAFHHPKSLILAVRDFHVAAERLVASDGGRLIILRHIIEPVGEESGFDTGEAEQRHLRESDALDGEEFLRVHGLVCGDQVGAEAFELLGLLNFDDGEVAGLELM